MLKQWHFLHSMETQPVVFDSITIIPRGRIGLFNFFFFFFSRIELQVTQDPATAPSLSAKNEGSTVDYAWMEN